MEQLYAHISFQLIIIVPMQIFPKKRPRSKKRDDGTTQWYTPTGPRERNLKGYFKQAMNNYRLPPYDTKLNVDCIYTCVGKCRCDKDNADKTIGDCGQGILWKNDKQIRDGRSTIIENAGKDSIQITIKEI